MPRTIRFHLDENCHGAVAEGLRRRGIDVSTTQEAGLLSAPDGRQLDHAIAEGRVIFTQDRDFLRLHAGGVAHSGLAYCDKEARTIGAIIRGLTLIWEVLEPEEMINRVEFL